MKKRTMILIAAAIVATVAIVLLCVGGRWLYIQNGEYTYDHTVAGSQAILRDRFVETAEKWLGTNESDGTHQQIIDLYNSHEPLAQGYAVQYDDEWCATFVSAVAIESGLTNIIPTECGCQRQIELFKEQGAWVEDDNYIPLPGDIIYYSWGDDDSSGDCTGWSDHVGIVIGTHSGHIKVIEGNKGGEVAYRILKIDAKGIRGFAVPDYALAAESE